MNIKTKRGISNKRGDMTTTQIVMLIILIVSFAVLLILYFRLGLGELSDKQICYNSVILKSKSPGSIGAGGLDCKTNYICISGGKDCKDMIPTKTIDVNPKEKQEIFKPIAEEMADCWWMFGEGKVDYVEYLVNVFPESHCAVCSVVKFDETIQGEFLDGFDYEEFYNFLSVEQVKEGQSYLNYLYGGIKDVSLLNYSIERSSGKFFTDKQYLIITGMKEENDYIYPYFIYSEELYSKEICRNFDITKA